MSARVRMSRVLGKRPVRVDPEFAAKKGMAPLTYRRLLGEVVLLLTKASEEARECARALIAGKWSVAVEIAERAIGEVRTKRATLGCSSSASVVLQIGLEVARMFKTANGDNPENGITYPGMADFRSSGVFAKDLKASYATRSWLEGWT